MNRAIPLLLCCLIPATLLAAEVPGLDSAEESYDLRQVLLRQSSVTVTPGQWQWDLDVNYLRAPTPGAEGNSTLIRDFTVENRIRAGVTDYLEAYASLPYVIAERETTMASEVSSDSTSDIGDLEAGIGLVLARETSVLPGVTLSLAASHPTGEDPYDSSEPYPAFTGSGHESLRGELNFVRSSDPLVFYWGIGFTYYDSEESQGVDIQPGNAFLYRFGVGFEVNRDASLIAEVTGAYQGEVELDGDAVDGSTSEPVLLRLAVTTRLARHVYLEPSVSFGMTDDAADVIAGITLVNRGAL